MFQYITVSTFCLIFQQHIKKWGQVLQSLWKKIWFLNFLYFHDVEGSFKNTTYSTTEKNLQTWNASVSPKQIVNIINHINTKLSYSIKNEHCSCSEHLL